MKKTAAQVHIADHCFYTIT